jgi:hypothetical protein
VLGGGGITALTGDVVASGLGSVAAAVQKINGATVPPSVAVLGTNSSSQIINAAGGISAALSTGAGMQIGGDSICAGTGSSNPFTNAFAFILRPVIGGFWNATCRPGDQLIDTTSVYVNAYIEPTSDGHYPLSMIEDGTNDVTQYGTSAPLQTTWQLIYLHDIATNGIAFSQKEYPAASLTNWTATGSWAADSTQASIEPDYVSTTNGNTLAYAVTCAGSCVGILDWPIWNGNGGTFTISLDGTPLTVPYGGGGTTFYAEGFTGATITATSGTAATFTKAAVRVPMSSGAHTITVTVTSATSGSNKVGVSYFAVVPTASITNPNVEAISLQHQNNANDALSGTYTGYISAMVTQAATDGLNAYYANVRDAMLNTNVPVGLYVASAGTSYTAPQWVAHTSVQYAETRALLTLVGSAPAQGQYTMSAGVYGFNAADSNTPLIFNFTTNCGATEAAMFTNCNGGDPIHPDDLGHAVYASVIASSLPSRLATGNNLPQVTYPTRNYLSTRQFPSQMMSPSASYSLTNIPAGPGFYPGFNWGCYVSQCYFETLTGAGGLTTVVPNVGSGVVWSLATYTSPVQPTSESQLSPQITITGNGIFTSYISHHVFNGDVTINACPGPSQYCYPFSMNIDNYHYVNGQQVMLLTNSHLAGVMGTRIVGQGTGAQIWETGVGNSSVDASAGVCPASNLWYMGNYTSGTCTLAESMDSTNVHKFNFGLAAHAYTVSALPTASTLAAGTQLVVSDAASFTPGPCTGGGSDYMIAVTNGTAWSCH